MRKLIAIIVTAFVIASCNNQNQTKTMDSSKNEKLIKQYFEHFNSHNWKKMSEMYTETADFKDPSLGQGIVQQSRRQIENKYEELNSVFPDLKDSIVQIYPSGENHIIVEFVSTGTAADNSKFELPICTIFTIENGLITKDFTYFDNFDEEGSGE